MLKTFQLASCLSKLSINGAECGIFSKRAFSLTSELNRKKDSRAHPPYKLPGVKSGRWVKPTPMHEKYEYTIEPLPFPSLGGRGPNGRIWNHKRGGGLKKVFFMIDHNRANPNLIPDGEHTLRERVYEIKPDQNRSGLIALVASGEHKRYIIATENMKVGDEIISTTKIAGALIRPILGNSYPLGSLPIGTVICNVEKTPGEGGYLAKAAGTSAVLVRKQKAADGEEMCVIKMPSKREIIVPSRCQATVGRISNVDHDKEHWGKAGAKRNAGIRPRSGLWHRKDGRHGRKIRPLPPPLDTKNLVKKIEESTFKLKGYPYPGLMQRSSF